jgi:hypothetical protein
MYAMIYLNIRSIFMAAPRKKLATKKCLICGNAFTQKRYKSGPDSYFKKRKYCSKECAGVAFSVEIPAKQRRRFRVIEAYGGVCKCCGEAEWKFLSLDHVNNDGAEHRKKIGQSQIYKWAEDNEYPKTLQLLCYNCNMAKGFYGKCPHEVS